MTESIILNGKRYSLVPGQTEPGQVVNVDGFAYILEKPQNVSIESSTNIQITHTVGGYEYEFLKEAPGSKDTQDHLTEKGKPKTIIVFNEKQYNKPRQISTQESLEIAPGLNDVVFRESGNKKVPEHINSPVHVLKTLLSIKSTPSPELDKTVFNFEGYQYKKTGIISSKIQKSGVLNINGKPKTKIIFNREEYQLVSSKSEQSLSAVVESVSTLSSPAPVVESVSTLSSPAPVVESVSTLSSPVLVSKTSSARSSPHGRQNWSNDVSSDDEEDEEDEEN
jgi:hypothetical protein